MHLGIRSLTLTFAQVAGNTALSISGSPATTATVGEAYSFTPTVSGGTGPYTFSLASGTLPAGLSLNTSTGAITGTPTTEETAAGLVLRVTDANSDTADLASFQITVAAAGSGYTTGDFTAGDGLTIVSVTFSDPNWTVEMTDGTDTESAQFTESEMADIEAGLASGFVRGAQVSETAGVYSVDDDAWSFSADGSSPEFQLLWYLDDIAQFGETGESYDGTSEPGITYRKVSLIVSSSLGGSIETVAQTQTAYTSPLTQASGGAYFIHPGGIGIAEGATSGLDRYVYAISGYFPSGWTPDFDTIIQHKPFGVKHAHLLTDNSDPGTGIITNFESINKTTSAVSSVFNLQFNHAAGEQFAVVILAQGAEISVATKTETTSKGTNSQTIPSTDNFYNDGEFRAGAGFPAHRTTSIWTNASDTSYSASQLFDLMFNEDCTPKHPNIVQDALALGTPLIDHRGDKDNVSTNNGSGSASSGTLGTITDYVED